MIRRRATVTVLVATLFGFVLRADETSEKEALVQLEKNLASILVKHDPAALERDFSPDWRLVLSEGAIMTRAELVQNLKSGKLQFSSVSVEALDVRIYGDAAVVLGVAVSIGKWDGDDFTARDRFTDVFIRQDGKWRCVSSHNSDLNKN